MNYAKKKKTLKQMNKEQILNMKANEGFFFNVLMKIGLIEQEKTEVGKQFRLIDSRCLKLRELLEEPKKEKIETTQ